MDKICPGCGDSGFIDEADAHRLGLPPLVDGRTEPCPICLGTMPPPRVTTLARLALEAVVVAAIALAFGALVGAAIVLAQRFA